jgi:hypothetical protein
MLNFYAYIHCKPDGTPFYVGKGHGRRAYDLRGRSDWHKRVVAKCGEPGVHVGKLACSTEAAAFELEKGLIKRFRWMGVKLCNMTDGGEGTTGHTVSVEARAGISDKLKAFFAVPENREKQGRTKGRKRPPEEVARIAVQSRLMVRTSGHKEKIALSIRKHWALRQEKKKLLCPVAEGEKWCFECKQAKPLGLFGKHRRSLDGLNYVCKSCAAAQMRRTRAKRVDP